MDEAAVIHEMARISPYRPYIQQLADKLASVMQRNDQLNPLLEKSRKALQEEVAIKNYLDSQELEILGSFFEYIAFSSDEFAAEIHRNSKGEKDET